MKRSKKRYIRSTKKKKKLKSSSYISPYLPKQIFRLRGIKTPSKSKGILKRYKSLSLSRIHLHTK